MLDVTDTRSASSYQNTFAASAGISGSYMGTSFSGNADYQSMNQGANADRSFSFQSGTVRMRAAGWLGRCGGAMEEGRWQGGVARPMCLPPHAYPHIMSCLMLAPWAPPSRCVQLVTVARAQLAEVSNTAHKLTVSFLTAAEKIRNAAPGSADRTSALSALYNSYGT